MSFAYELLLILATVGQVPPAWQSAFVDAPPRVEAVFFTQPGCKPCKTYIDSELPKLYAFDSRWREHVRIVDATGDDPTIKYVRQSDSSIDTPSMVILVDGKPRITYYGNAPDWGGLSRTLRYFITGRRE